MHDGEFPSDEALVARLLTSQLPGFASLPVRAWPATGTANALFRLGDHLVARMPRLPRFAAALEREVAWRPRLAPRLSLRLPEPLAVGRPTSGFRCVWAVFRWLDGVAYGDGVVADEWPAARALAGLGVGDPAMDLVAACSVFGPSGRVAFGAAIEHDARLDLGAWERARGYALHQAALIVLYYAASNPGFAAEAVRIVGEVLGEDG